jgi:hypothetical protein
LAQKENDIVYFLWSDLASVRRISVRSRNSSQKSNSKILYEPKLHGFFGQSLEIVLLHHDFGQGVEAGWVFYAAFEQFYWVKGRDFGFVFVIFDVRFYIRIGDIGFVLLFFGIC